MKKKILFAFSFLIFGIFTYSLVTSQTIIPPTFADNVLFTTISADAPPRICNTFSRNLGIGIRSSEVITLQDKLREYGYFNHVSTGYFGFITLNAVRAYQKDNGIIATGYFGPLTREAINNKHCYVPPVSPIVIDPGPNEPPYNCKVWYDGCNTCGRSVPGGLLACTEMMCIQGGDEAWFIAHKPRCMEYFDSSTTNLTPIIKSVSGPTQLKVGETGTWTINASIADNSNLIYEVNWGEADKFLPHQSVMASANTFSQTSTFQHIYNTAGVYKITIKVKAVNGQIVEATQTVNVENKTIAEPPYNCKSWFDGCNNCGRSYPGGPMYCTLMACLDNTKPSYCSEYY